MGAMLPRVLLLVLLGAASVIGDCDSFQPAATPLLWPAVTSTLELRK